MQRIPFLNEPLYKNIIYLVLNVLVGQGAGFLFWLIAARFYSVDQIGVTTAVISLMLLIMMFSRVGLDISIIGLISKENDKNGIINSFQTVVGILSVILSILIVPLSTYWDIIPMDIGSDCRFYILFIIFTTINSISTLQNNIFIGFRNSRLSLLQGLGSSSRVLILPIFVSFGVMGIYASYGLGIFIGFLVGLSLIFRVLPDFHPYPKINYSMVKNHLNFSTQNYLTRIFEELPTYLLPIMIISSLGAEKNAYYYIAWSIFSGIVLMIPRASSLALFSEAAHNPSQMKNDLLKSTKIALLCTFLLMIFVIVFGDILLGFYGKNYSEGAFSLLKIFSFSGIPFVIVSTFIAMERAQKKARAGVNIYAISTIILLMLSYFLIPICGLEGVGIAWFLSQLIPSIWCGVKIINNVKVID